MSSNSARYNTASPPPTNTSQPASLLRPAIKLLRAVYSRHQLEAVLLDFFLNHFNVNGFTRIAIWAEQSYEQDSLRPHVLGRFEDLVQAMAEGLAMLDYLDQRRSRVGNVNENFARELAELHTVGKVGTFDEQDVQEITRVLTGYTYDSDRVFEYKAYLHDPGVKVVTLENTEPWVFDGTLGGAKADARPGFSMHRLPRNTGCGLSVPASHDAERLHRVVVCLPGRASEAWATMRSIVFTPRLGSRSAATDRRRSRCRSPPSWLPLAMDALDCRARSRWRPARGRRFQPLRVRGSEAAR